MSRSARVVEYGDFQTPPALAEEICGLLARLGERPVSLVEPTCGVGNLLFAALEEFGTVRHCVAGDLSAAHVSAARGRLAGVKSAAQVALHECDFFRSNWPERLRRLPDPLLVVGNPPWVTNAAVGGLGGSNLPDKANFRGLSGLDALTGKSNFDISEAMLGQVLDCLNGRHASLAMLCKTSVARKLIEQACHNRLSTSAFSIYGIDAQSHFGAGVDACLLYCAFAPGASCSDCRVYEGLGAVAADRTIGYRDGALVCRAEFYDRWRHLGSDGRSGWRSGIKHDCAAVMELRRSGRGYVNGLGERVEIEDDFVYPLMKTSDVARIDGVPSRYLLVPQPAVGVDTARLRECAPRTWRYLSGHGSRLDGRRSSVYKNAPRFAVFGVGPYSFAPWKVAISGFYKRLGFRAIGPWEGRPVVLDDSTYFLSFVTECEADRAVKILDSDPAREFYGSLVFWDSKRPITIGLLRKLDLDKCAAELGLPWSGARAAEGAERTVPT